MSISAAQANAFYREAVENRVVWTIRDLEGVPAPVSTSGQRAMPFWSLQSRAVAVIESVPAYARFEPLAIPLDVFRERWLTGLEKDGLLVGLNWSRSKATGYDVSPQDVHVALAARGV